MPPSWSNASRSSGQRYPPPPCVEEEHVSLARELHGLSKIGELPGVEGACVRGTVDQYPAIVNSNSPTLDTTPGVSDLPGLDNVSSDDNSGPITPPPGIQEPSFSTSSVRSFARHSHGRSAATATAASLSRSQNRPPRAPLSRSPDRNAPRQPQTTVDSQDGYARRNEPSTPYPAPASNRDRQPVPAYSLTVHDSKPPRAHPTAQLRYGSPVRVEGPVYAVRHTPRGSVHHRLGDYSPEYDQNFLSPPQTSLGRSNSARHGGSTASSARHHRRESPAGYSSDSATKRKKRHGPYAARSSANVSRRQPDTTNATLAGRLEEKLQIRQDQRARELSNTATVQPAASALRPLNPSQASRSPSRDPQHVSISHSQGRPRASTVTAAGPSAPLSRSTSMTRNASKSMSSDEAQNRSSRSQRASVKFHEPQSKRASIQVPSQQISSPQRPANTTGICITPCPRSVAVAGYTDWYTLKGLTHLDICPTCMSQIAHSRFRDFFIPTLPKPPTQKTRCAFALPWTRLAWAQMINKKHDSLEMLYQMTRPPPGTRPCFGRVASTQTWHRIVDPETGTYLPRFHVCSSCVRNIRILMPSHRDTFHASPEPQERTCDFVTTSPRFVQYIDHLDDAATRAETDSSRRPDVREFLAYTRRKIVLRDCHRDIPSLGKWYYIPVLPELSVCEDCYDEVVWPLAKAHHRIARMFLLSMRLLPGDAPNRCREASCQLYSGRMRARFRDTVVKGDFGSLKALVLRRFEAERRFRDRRDELLVAEGSGYDCDEEMRKAAEEWKRWE